MRLWLLVLAAAPGIWAQQGDDFFEKRIRPVLATRCFTCHGERSNPPRGNLRLDTKAGLRSVVTPNSAAHSRLYTAISYTHLDLRMPPTGKLSDSDIVAFRDWIDAGAHDPRSDQPEPSRSANRLTDPALGRRFWAFQPLLSAAPPAVNDNQWPRTRIDHFLLARLEARNLKPASDTGRGTWLRRVTFDLTGLPPSPSELEEFVADKSPKAYERVVERLLASPHYGERWARHWLDLVRFAETNGHEFDNDKLDAWRYRDYVIRAFNEDVPFNQFAREHIAGDLLPHPRVSRDNTHLESPLGTSAFWFGEVLNSATDSVKSRADTVDNQIDVLGKAFLGLTIACARCHDHKFDPIPTRDYYALAGVLHSTNIREAVVDSPARAAAIQAAHERLPSTAKLGPAPELKLREGDVLFEDFENHGEWYGTGEAFRKQWEAGFASSAGRGTARLVGSLTSRKFRMPKLWVHVRLAGTPDSRVTIVADDHKSAHLKPNGKPGFHWRSARMTKEIGRQCYFELVDRSR
ncbi:MAG: DUF1549 domain-containing protein, partial [Bryobacterales bacterium]|nr:DUF1549 domain-containing protein [Bryobacterales bacterium]